MKRVNAFALMAMALPLAGLSVEASAADCPKGKIKIYTSWPLQGAMLPEGTGMKNGVNLAVDQNTGEAGGYCLEVVNLDDASPQTGK
jgi:branched-chain amino acid transport system substrate-binding protein